MCATALNIQRIRIVAGMCLSAEAFNTNHIILGSKICQTFILTPIYRALKHVIHARRGQRNYYKA